MRRNHTQLFGLESNSRLISDKEGAALYGCSVATWWRRVADGTLPKPIRIGGMSRWPISEVLEVIELAKAERDECEG